MADRIFIQRLEFQGSCGVTLEERQFPQPLAVDAELDCDIAAATTTDDVEKTVDYARVAQRIVELGSKEHSCLLETLAERLVSMIFAEFPVERVRLWVRKLDPPIKLTTASVGVRLDRTRLSQQTKADEAPPAKFLSEQVSRLPKGKVLDVAAGSGRNGLYLAAQGYRVEAIDRDEEALARLTTSATQRHLANVGARVLDLEQEPPPELPKEEYDVIVVFFYLHRALFPALLEALKPNGMLVYETFTIDNYLHYRHPKRWEFCLAQNELLRLASRLRLLHYDEGQHEDGHGGAPLYTAQLVAQKAGPIELPHEPR